MGNEEPWIHKWEHHIKELKAVAENEQTPVLDRIDAYLELAQTDSKQCWGYITEARKLCTKDS